MSHGTIVLFDMSLRQAWHGVSLPDGLIKSFNLGKDYEIYCLWMPTRYTHRKGV